MFSFALLIMLALYFVLSNNNYEETGEPASKIHEETCELTWVLAVADYSPDKFFTLQSGGHYSLVYSLKNASQIEISQEVGKAIDEVKEYIFGELSKSKGVDLKINNIFSHHVTRKEADCAMENRDKGMSELLKYSMEIAKFDGKLDYAFQTKMDYFMRNF